MSKIEKYQRATLHHILFNRDLTSTAISMSELLDVIVDAYGVDVSDADMSLISSNLINAKINSDGLNISVFERTEIRRSVLHFVITSTAINLINRVRESDVKPARVDAKLSLKYSQDLLNYLMSVNESNSNAINVDILTLVESLGITSGYMNNIAQIKFKILDPSIEEINLKTDYEIDVNTLVERTSGRGRAGAIGYSFLIKNHETFINTVISTNSCNVIITIK